MSQKVGCNCQCHYCGCCGEENTDLASEAKNAVSYLHAYARHADDPGFVHALADRLWALADKAQGKGS